MTDEQLQQEIESGQTPKGNDSLAYQKVFNALRKDLYILPVDFADRVLFKLQQKPAFLCKEYFWMATGWVLLLVAAVVSIRWISFKFTWGTFQFFSGYPGLVGLAFVLLAIVQWLDKRLLKSNNIAE